MSEKRTMEAGAVSFSERLASSQVFAALFRDGMALVEETASYLDGPGRQESKKLERSAGLMYATESMRLTTRLMQLASWLLLHRAVKEGEMTLAQASKEKSKVRLATCEPGDARSIALLPLKLQELIRRSVKLQGEVRRLDATMHAPPPCQIAGGQPGRASMGAFEGGLRIRSLSERGAKPGKAACRLFLQKAGKLFLEARHTAAAVEQVLLAAGPGRMRFRVDIEMQRIAGLAPGGARGEFGAVGHDDLDGVIVGMGICFHDRVLLFGGFSGSIARRGLSGKPPHLTGAAPQGH